MQQWMKYLLKLPPKQQKRFEGIINDILNKKWEGYDIVKMQGKDNRYRCRVGDLRIMFEIDAHGVVRLHRVGSRGDVYKK